MNNSASAFEAWPDLRQQIGDLVSSGRTNAIEALLIEKPRLRSHEQLLLDCIYAEYCFREEHDQAPLPGEYLQRFPEYTKQLQALFEVHAAFDTPSVFEEATMPIPRPGENNPALHARHLVQASVLQDDRPSSRRIGPYKLLQLVGEGGMGAVYMADQLEPVKRRVALKLIKSGMDSKQVVARFEAERQALAMMDHQNIAKVLDAGITEDGTPYFAMELVQGMPITKYCDREKLSIPNRLKLFVQVCRAIQHAHQKGVIHRDIKPSNVLVTQCDGVPVAKVIDFGLAKAMQNELRLTDKTLFTEVGQVCGTLEYMSPEQAEVNEPGLDTRTDVYSLGVLLYELLTGSTPLNHDRIRKEPFHRVLQLILTEETPSPSRRLSDLGDAITGISEQRGIEPRRYSGILKRELDWIALKALEKARNRRYDGAGLLADDVQNYLDGEVVTARPPSTGYRLLKAVRKHRAAFVSGSAVVLLLIAGLIGTGTMWLRALTAEKVAVAAAEHSLRAERNALHAKQTAEQAERDAVHGRQQAEQQREAAIAARSQAEWLAYASQISLAQREWENGDAGNACRALNRCQLNLRGWEHDYLYTLFNQNQTTLNGQSGPVGSASFSPDGTRIVSGSEDTTVKVWDAARGQETLTLGEHTNEAVRQVAFSPDGRRIFSAWSDTFRVWDAATGTEITTFKGHTGNVSSVSFSPDGTRIASDSDDRTVKVWNVASGQETLTLAGHRIGVNSVAFSPDGTRIVSGGWDKFIKVWDATKGLETLALKGHTRHVTSVSFSRDGRQIVSGSFDGTVKVWDVARGQETMTLTGLRGQVLTVAFSPDGTRIVSGGWDEFLKVWDATTGLERLTLEGHADPVLGVAFNPNGTRIISASRDKTVKVWDAASGQELLTLKGHTGWVNSVAFSPDGTRIVSGSEDGSIKVWDASMDK